MSHTIQDLFKKNVEWAESVKERDPEFFDKLSGQQTPKFLWIGCADSRVPSTQIVDLMPGDIFVHRNVANVVVHTDLNCLSVMQYAVDVLKVEHIIVCGHYGCGGVAAALGNKPLGLIDNWLEHIRDVIVTHADELDKLSGQEKIDRLCELNVLEQAENVRRSAVYKGALARGQNITIHSWVYGIKDGLVRALSW